MKFIYSTCGAEHDIGEISFGSDAPVQWALLSDAERSRSLLADDQCEIESNGRRSFYIRGYLDIPIKGTDRFFRWGVWCSLSEKSYKEMSEHWDDPDRTRLGPYFGWLCTKLPGYPDTVFLKTMVHQKEVSIRPFVELEATDHPLSVDQRNSIEEERLREMVMGLLHQNTQ